MKNARTLVLIVGLFSVVTSVYIWRTVRSGHTGAGRPDVLGELKLIPQGITAKPTELPVPIAPMTLDTVFSANHAWVRNLPQDRTVTMIATGDVIPARSVNYAMTVGGRGYDWPFDKTRGILTAADMTVINLETPLLSVCPPTQTGMVFCGDARVTQGLVSAGVDVATLGNNHVGNHFRQGIDETKKVLTEAGIVPVSEGPVVKTVKGIRFAFLAYNDIGALEDGVPWADDTRIRQEIADVRKDADVVIVAFHWGTEYVTQPNQRQRDLAHLTVDAGADVVLGNHPHWIEPVELYRGKYIIYAHGNFVFDQEWSPETKLGVVGRYTFFDGKLVDAEYLPVKIVDYGQPYFLEGDDAARIIKSMGDASRTLAGEAPN